MQIRLAKRSDGPAIKPLLEAALADDPFISWLTPAGSRRRAARRAYIELMLDRLAFCRGEVWVAEQAGTLLGASLWAPPGTFDLELSAQLRLLPLMLRVIGWRRLTRVARALEEIAEARPIEPHWLLTAIGVARACRGRGVGRALLSASLNRCDERGSLAVAETASPSNLGFYERLGFERGESRLLDVDGPRSWTLIRAPSAGIIPPEVS